MIWFRGLFIGFFTRHITTKFLALLLSIGLFGFVQASLTATLEITEITLVPTLAEESRNDYFLLTGNFVVNRLTIRGEQSKVEALARLAKSTHLRLPIGPRILSVYGKPQPNGAIEVPIDPELFRDDVLFGKDVTVERMESARSIVVAPREDRIARVEVAASLQGVTHVDYEDRLTFAPNWTSVTIRGPKNAFDMKPPRIVVSVRGIADRISQSQIQGERGTLSFGEGVCEVEWRDGDINPDLVSFLRITPDRGDPLPASEFRQKLSVSCVATKRKETITLAEIPLQIRYAMPQRFNLLDHYGVFPPFSGAEMEDGSVKGRLKVRLPAAMRDDQAFLNNLVLVLDVAHASDGADPVGSRGLDELGERLEIPYFLDVRDRSRAEDVRRLEQVALVAEDGAVAEFSKLKKKQ